MAVDYVAYHDNTSAQHQAQVDAHFPKGFRFVSLSVYGSPADPRYVGVLVRRSVPIAQVARHGLSSAQLQAVFDEFAPQDFAPAIITATGPAMCVQAGGNGLADARFSVIFARQEEVVPRQFTATGIAVPELAALDELMKLGMQKSGTRGGALAAARDGRLVFARGYTWAEPGYQITQPTSLFRTASCSKALTAIVAEQLIEQGLLSAEDLVQPILKLEKPPGGSFSVFDGKEGIGEIKVKHLLNHTSGLHHGGPGVFDVADAWGHPGQLPITKREYISVALCAMAFRPGGPIPQGVDNYSNTGYVLLGMVIEAKTGLTYEQAVRKLLFAPLEISRGAIGKSLIGQRFAGEVFYHTIETLAVGKSQVTSDQPSVPSQYGMGGDMLLNDAGGSWVMAAPDFARVLAAFDRSPAAPVFAKSGTRQALWDCGVWERPSPFDNAHDPDGKKGFTRVKGGGFAGTNALVLHRDDSISVAVFLNSDFWPSDPAMSISQPPVDGTWLNFQVNERLNAIKAWPRHPFPPIPTWHLNSNGFEVKLMLDTLDASGNLQGRILDGGRTDPVRGVWNADTRTLTFTCEIGSGDPTTVQVYTGHLLQGDAALTGWFEAFGGTGGTARMGVFGWLAVPPLPPIKL